MSKHSLASSYLDIHLQDLLQKPFLPFHHGDGKHTKEMHSMHCTRRGDRGMKRGVLYFALNTVGLFLLQLRVRLYHFIQLGFLSSKGRSSAELSMSLHTSTNRHLSTATSFSSSNRMGRQHILGSVQDAHRSS